MQSTESLEILLSKNIIKSCQVGESPANMSTHKNAKSQILNKEYAYFWEITLSQYNITMVVDSSCLKNLT